MFANRYTALIDACVLTPALLRNLLLTLAEAGFFRARWSEAILSETERALTGLMGLRGLSEDEARMHAALQVRRMTEAFPDALVHDITALDPARIVLPDPDDLHVLAAALQTRADVIVTDNLKDFPAPALAAFDLEARSGDDFIADAIALDEGRAVAALRRMRGRFARPELTPEQLLLKMEAVGLTESVDALRPHLASL